jgi:hypothetical protein
MAVSKGKGVGLCVSEGNSFFFSKLIEAMVKNCDITVHREISSRSFSSSLVKLVKDRVSFSFFAYLHLTTRS